MDIPLHVDRSQPQPLHRQVYDQIRQGIESRRLRAGTRLPSSRELAARLGVARNTIAHVYDRLVAEGYLDSRVGAWTAVALSPPGADVAQLPRCGTGDRTASTRASRLSQRLTVLRSGAELSEAHVVPVAYDFRSRRPAIAMSEWQKVLARHWAGFETCRTLSRVPEGDVQLRGQLARYLGAARAVECTPDQIVITNSDQQAVSLIAHLTVDMDDQVLMEDPGNPGPRLAFQAYGASVIPVPVDADGIDPDAVTEMTSPRARLLYVTPSHQLPTGATLDHGRRSQLLRWAAETETLIVEDDRDSGYRYGEPPLASLQGLDPDRVIYVGSLKQVVGGTLGVAYLVVPPVLVEPVIACKRVIDKGPPPFVQSALAEFMASGLFDRHLRQMLRHHRSRRDALCAALRASFGGHVTIGPASAGTFVHVRWHRHPATPRMIDAALHAQVGLYPVAPCYLRWTTQDPGVIMFYAGLGEDQIRGGVQRLAEVLAGLN